MKQILYAFLFLSLFSFLFSIQVKQCLSKLVLICTELTLSSCSCYLPGEKIPFAKETRCNSPYVPTCFQNYGEELKCACTK